MRGFLDPEYSTLAHDFRRVLDTLVLQVSPKRVFGYGANLREISGSLGVLGRPSLYKDGYTRIDQALQSVSADTSLAKSHILLGDGRRSSPEEAREQFTTMVAVANTWIERGGVFVIGVSSAPFRTVAGDPSGCGLSSETDPKEQQCPLYAFSFVTASALSRIGQLMTAAFEHVFVWPVPTAIQSEIVRDTAFPFGNGSAGVRFEQRWTMIGARHSVSRYRSDSVMRNYQKFRIQAVGETPIEEKWNRALLEQAPVEIEGSVSALAQTKGPRVIAWQTIDFRQPASILQVDNSLGMPFVGVRATGKRGSPSLLRVRVVGTLRPSWLSTFAATGRSDPVRTMGLELLFIGLRPQVGASTGTAYLLVN
jgi:hypothetical protein